MELFGDPIPLLLPRHSVSPRQVARAGEIWRQFQVAAVEASARRGWTPERMLAAGAAFIVAHMTVVHHREATFGEPLQAWAWLRDFRRGILTRREIRLFGEGGDPIARTTQQWVYVDQSLKPTRAPAVLQDAFEVRPTADPPVSLPDFEEDAEPGPWHSLAFEVWHSWMDPIGHVNHPVYVDWCDEALARVVAEGGGDPQGIVPVAERVRFRRGALGLDPVVLRTRRIGRTADGALALEHRVEDGEDGIYAEAISLRRLADGSDLGALLG